MWLRAWFAACALAAAGAAQEPGYQVIMWSTGAPRDWAQWGERLREIGVTAEQCPAGADPARYLRAGLGFYVENLVPELGFLNNRKPIYDADFAGYTKTREKQYLVRKPCFHDEEFWAAARARLQALVRPVVGQGALFYDLRDELSVGSLASPMDYCFGPHSLTAFRQWARERYGSLEALNREWETQFESWEAVEPMTTYEIKDRERAALAAGAPENYAPWADHRAFMDETFAGAIERLRGYIREVDGATPVGIEGTQMPSAWGGYDLWRLSRAVDWVEPYDIAGSREVWRSFLPQGAPVVGTIFGDDFARIRQKLWWLVLHGDRGVIIWDDEKARSIAKEQEGLPVTDRGRGLARIFAELKEGAPRIMQARRLDDRIAIHYSQASLRAHWMFDSRQDRDTWPRRFSSYEAAFSRIGRVRDSFMRAIEDIGLQYNFVSYEQIENGELLREGYRVLLLPQSVAISERERAAIEEFVRAGGTAIADNMTGTMDEHCRRLPRGQLDELFGVERKGVAWRSGAGAGEAFEPDLALTTGKAQRTTAAGVPMVIENRVGEGRAVYLNLGMHDYGRQRLTPPGGEATRELFARLLREAGLTPRLQVVNAGDGTPVPCVEIWRYEGFAAVMRNPEFNAEGLKQAGYPNNSEIDRTVRVRILADGETRMEADLEPWRPLLVEMGRTVTDNPEGARRGRPARRRVR